jgi:hypothetical protein
MRQKSSCECFVALAAAPETKNVEKIGATACVGLGGGGLWTCHPFDQSTPFVICCFHSPGGFSRKNKQVCEVKDKELVRPSLIREYVYLMTAKKVSLKLTTHNLGNRR